MPRRFFWDSTDFISDKAHTMKERYSIDPTACIKQHLCPIVSAGHKIEANKRASVTPSKKQEVLYLLVYLPKGIKTNPIDDEKTRRFQKITSV